MDNYKGFILKRGVKLEVVREIEEMQKISMRVREKGLRIGFVPTMGALHEGHLSLVRRAKSENDVVCVSIFVNPIQFAPGEDFERYPRDIEGDLRKLEQFEVDYVFIPREGDMYPEGFSTYVEVKGNLTEIMCALHRPGHFVGVTTVVAKLFNIVLPHRAYFGKKDYQQMRIIEKMVKDLNFPVEIVEVETMREEDGLAMSSRNVYLRGEERESALSLYRSLQMAKEMIEKGGERDPERIKEVMRGFIEKFPHVKEIDYIDIREAETLKSIDYLRSGERVVIALAVHVGSARLIDNIEVEVP